MEENKETLGNLKSSKIVGIIGVNLAVPEKKKRGRPVGWRGTYKKKVQEIKEEVK
jgi:hypothetical protein